MSSLFRGALNLIQGDVSGSPTNPLVGRDVDVGGVKLRIKAQLAEGGFAVVFSAQDQHGQYFALKRQLAHDKDAYQAVMNEINTLKELNGHPSIIRYHQAAQTKITAGSEFLILTELCSGGSVVDLLKNVPPEPSAVIKIFHSACRAVEHMHCRDKPITHRDIKVENLLFDSRGRMKLCDFGSSTRLSHNPDDSWTSTMRVQMIEEMQRNTTPMYRPPEIQDEYMNLPVGVQQDVWALGCVLFYLCYRVHPFEDSAKLRIVNARYAIPADDVDFTMFVPLIQQCLRTDPRERPKISDLAELASVLAVAMDVNLDSPVKGVVTDSVNNHSQANFGATSTTPAAAPPRPPPPRSDDVSQQASAMFGAWKGQSMSFIKNIKDRSAAVVQTVQSTYGSRGPDVKWVTARVVLAPQQEAVPEPLAHSAEDVLRAYCTELGRPFLVINISQRRLKCDFPNQPIESLMSSYSVGLPPTVDQLLKLCRSMSQFLRQNPNGFVVIYGTDAHCVLLAVSLTLYGRLLPHPTNAIELLGQRRGAGVVLPPSFHRSIDLISKIVRTPRDEIVRLVHNRSVNVLTLTMEPLPIANRVKTGCRPFAEIFSGGTRLWNTCKDYEGLRQFDKPDYDAAEFDLGNIPVGDDVTIIVYHARWSKLQNKMQQVRMFSFGFHANFIAPNTRQLTFHKGDLDVNADETVMVPDTIRIVLGLRVGSTDRGFNNGVAEQPQFIGYDPESVNPRCLVEDAGEYDAIKSSCELGLTMPERPQRTEPPRPAPTKNVPAPAPTADFFSTLPWEQNSQSSQNAPSTNTHGSAVSQDLFSLDASSSSVRATTSSPVAKPAAKTLDAESYERMYGIRVGKEEEDEDAHKYRFDCDKQETPIMGQPSPVQSLSGADISNAPPVEEFDLLGLGASTGRAHAAPVQPSNDLFGDFVSFGSTPAAPAAAPVSSNDLLGDWGSSAGLSAPASQQMHRNVSAPAFGGSSAASASSAAFDPFADFLSSAPVSSSNPSSKQGSATNSGSTTPMPSRPNYNRSAFDTINPPTAKPKVTADSFGDLLSSQGFTASSKNSNRTMGDMRRADDIRDMDPIQIKIRDWTQGKEKNIRALLGSLNDVLWDDADKWTQPSMADLLSAAQVKKWYRKACLVVHPDKQTGTPQEELAKAVFTQLNESWTAFEEAGSPSL